MRNVFQETITALEQELDALDQRRGDLAKAIEAIRPLAGEEEPAAPRRSGRPSGRPKNAVKRTNERTNEQGPRQRAARSLPDDDDHAAIVRALRKGPMKPGDLARAVKLSMFTLRTRVKALVKQRAVVVSGKTMSRLISLPKEDL